MVHLNCVVALALLASSSVPLKAEKAPMSPEQLRKTATHIVTGQVISVYERTETAGDWKYTKYVAEVRISECEKGDGLAKGDPVYIRYWTRSWIGQGQVPTSTTGHRDLPGDGNLIRVYLSRNAYDGFGDNKDGGFNVIGANGFEKLKSASEK